MAKMAFRMPDEFLHRISRLADKTDEIVPKVLKAGADVVVEKVRSNLESAIGHNTQEESRSTGQLLGALGVSPAKLNRDGNHDVKIGFAENRDDRRKNALIANVMEHGSSTQPARPFLAPAKRATKQSSIDTMAAQLEKEINNI